MKKRLIFAGIALFVAVAAIIVYVTTRQDESVIYMSEEGFLEDGMKYRYSGTGQYDFDLQAYVEGGEFLVEKLDMTRIATSPREAAEVGRTLGVSTTLDVNEVEILVWYDKRTDCWVTIPRFLNIVPTGFAMYAIRRSDGVVTVFFQGG